MIATTHVCRCHADGYLYGSLIACPHCGHRSYDPTAEACERRNCGYVAAKIAEESPTPAGAG